MHIARDSVCETRMIHVNIGHTTSAAAAVAVVATASVCHPPFIAQQHNDPVSVFQRFEKNVNLAANPYYNNSLCAVCGMKCWHGAEGGCGAPPEPNAKEKFSIQFTHKQTNTHISSRETDKPSNTKYTHQGRSHM